MRKNYQGLFVPTNKSKYKGDITNIVFRSSWELKFFRWLDGESAVIEWSSETLTIPYVSPVDNKIHRYFPDIVMKVKQSDGKIKTTVVEIKPAYQTVPPKQKKNVTPGYLSELKTYAVNQSKWRAAERFCKDVNADFQILTELELFGTTA